jgi:cyclophilin family peptidyl-prolyl cis-trans isomerase
MSAEPEDTLVLQTTQGTVVIAMRPDVAPEHVARIKELVRDGFYDGVVFHRVIEGFMAQTGDPTGTGRGGSGKKLRRNSPRKSTCAEQRPWQGRKIRIPAIASSSSASTTHDISTVSTRCGVR